VGCSREKWCAAVDAELIVAAGFRDDGAEPEDSENENDADHDAEGERAPRELVGVLDDGFRAHALLTSRLIGEYAPVASLRS